MDVSKLEMGDVIDIYPYDGKIVKNGETVAEFALKSDVLLDEVRAGGRINLIIGRSLTAKARETLGLPASTVFRLPQGTRPKSKAGFTLAQKMVGRACGLPEGQGVRPAPTASQDDHRGLARHHRPDDPRRAEGPGLPGLLGRPGDAVVLPHRRLSQAVDVKTHRELPAFISNRGGVALRPGRRRDPQLAQPPAVA